MTTNPIGDRVHSPASTAPWAAPPLADPMAWLTPLHPQVQSGLLLGAASGVLLLAMVGVLALADARLTPTVPASVLLFGLVSAWRLPQRVLGHGLAVLRLWRARALPGHAVAVLRVQVLRPLSVWLWACGGPLLLGVAALGAMAPPNLPADAASAVWPWAARGCTGMALALLWAGAWQGVLHRAWLVLVALAAAALAALHLHPQATEALAHLPATARWTVWALLAAALPAAWWHLRQALLAATTHGRPASAAAAGAATAGAAGGGNLPSPQRDWRRWHRFATHHAGALDGGRGLNPLLLAFLLGEALVRGTPMVFPPGWGSAVTVLAPAGVLFWASLMVTSLRTDPLHWRHRLAPGAPSAAAFGPRAVLRSAAYLLLVLTALELACLLLLSVWWDAAALQAWRDHSLHILPTFFCDWLAGCALAAWLRAMRPDAGRTQALLQWAWACWIVAALVVALALGYPAWPDRLPALWQRDWEHHVGMLLLAAGFTALASRSWARGLGRTVPTGAPGAP